MAPPPADRSSDAEHGFAETVRDYVAERRVDDALKALRVYGQRHRAKALMNFAAVKQGQLKAADNDLRIGVLTDDQYEARISKIGLDVLEALDQLEVPATSTAPAEGGEGRDAPPSSETTPFLRCTGVTKHFQRGFKLPPIDITLGHGQIAGVVGFNGTGKTTLLRMLAGELSLTAGSIELSPVDDRKRPLQTLRAYVAQTPLRWGGTLERHLRRQAAFAGYTNPERNEEVVDGAIGLLGLSGHRTFIWDELSSGFRTRAAIAAAVVANPGLLVLDEPLAALDPRAQQRLLAELKTYARVNKTAIVVSSQHVPEIESIADKVIVLRGRGAFVQDRSQVMAAPGKRFEISARRSGRGLTETLERMKPSLGLTYVIGESKTWMDLRDGMSIGELAAAIGLPDLSYVRDISDSSVVTMYDVGDAQ